MQSPNTTTSGAKPLPLTARTLAKCEARKRLFVRLYAEFDCLPKTCRDAHRKIGSWDVYLLRKCYGRVCGHGVN